MFIMTACPAGCTSHHNTDVDDVHIHRVRIGSALNASGVDAITLDTFTDGDGVELCPAELSIGASGYTVDEAERLAAAILAGVLRMRG